MARSKSEKSAVGLLNHLANTGAPEGRLKPLTDWCNAQKNTDELTADELLDHMIEQKVSYGTLRRAGKWTRGDSWEPDVEETDAIPKDRYDALQTECENLRRENRRKDAELSAVKTAHKNDKEELARLDAKVKNYEFQLKEKAETLVSHSS